MLIAVDIGNSRTVSGKLLGQKVLHRSAVPTRNLQTFSQANRWAQTLKKAWGGRDTVVSSVVPGVDSYVKRALRAAFKREPLFVDVRKDPGLPVHYKKPAEIGADRVVNALAAKTLYGAPVIVVDYGTATTFDIVDAQGGYKGGVILPGVGISLQALYEKTAKLPLVPFARVKKPIGLTTQEGIRSGIYFGTLGATREILLGIRKQLGRVAPAVATGGWCGAFRGTPIFRYINPDLTLVGLSLYWENRNHGKY
jgi:type III pantothenate kinase